MYLRIKHIFQISALAGLIFISACDEDEAFAPIAVNFTNTEAGISESNASVTVGITFSRAAEASGSLVLSVAGDLTYGDDYVTDPAANDGTITLSYVTGDESVNLTVSAGTALNITEDQTLTFTLSDPSELVSLGQNSTFELVFSENFVAPAGTAKLDAGGVDFTHVAYYDLSKLTHTKVEKQSWDLGFSSAAGHTVYLNNSVKMMARMIDKSDLTAVSEADTTGFAASQSFNAFNPETIPWVDAPDLSTLAIGTVHSTDSDNKVYIVSRDGLDWQKVRVLQNGDGYSIQYADIAATSFETVDITKDDQFNEVYFSFEDGIVSAQPKKDAWDIRYGTFVNFTNFGTGIIPYSFSDFILINTFETSAVQVMIEGNVTYEGFNASDITSLTFDSTQGIIGSEWRQGGGPGQAPALFEDRFYVIKDAQSNYYKVRFTSMTSTEGERGHAEFKFELL